MIEAEHIRQKVGKLFRHTRSGGLYEVTGSAMIEKTWTLSVLYHNVHGGPQIARPYDEFFDGRFEEVEE